MNVHDLEQVLKQIAPPALAAQWDNVGLLVGDRAAPVRRAMLCIDLSAAVLAEARARRAEIVIAYHPPIFKPLSKVTAQDTPVVYQALRSGLAVYSPHTALDVVPGGTNDVLAGVLRLQDVKPLEPLTRPGHCKIAVFVQPDNLDAVTEAAWAAGAGHIGNYDRCSFRSGGTGTFRPLPGTNPTVGQTLQDEHTQELRLEFIAPCKAVPAITSAIRRAHSYEEPAIDICQLMDAPEGCGQGRVGRLPAPGSIDALVRRVKRQLGVSRVMVARAQPTVARGKPAGDRRIEVAAVGAGSCGSLFQSAIAAGATFFLTGEMRHHDLLAATTQGMTCVCVGHSNSERIALAALASRLRERLPKLELLLSQSDRDPIEIE